MEGHAGKNLPWPLILFGVMFLSGMLRRAIGRLGGAAVTGVIGGVAGWLLSSLWWVALGSFVGVFLFALLFGAAGGGKARGGRVFRDTGGGGWGAGGGSSVAAGAVAVPVAAGAVAAAVAEAAVRPAAGS